MKEIEKPEQFKYGCWDASANVGYPHHDEIEYHNSDGSVTYVCVRCGEKERVA
jgi:hypothetical protein